MCAYVVIATIFGG